MQYFSMEEKFAVRIFCARDKFFLVEKTGTIPQVVSW
jgi:hypothetical protein